MRISPTCEEMVVCTSWRSTGMSARPRTKNNSNLPFEIANKCGQVDIESIWR